VSLRLPIAIAGATIIGAGIVTWILVQPNPAPRSGSDVGVSRPASDTEHRGYREKFFGGDPDRNVRGGQEMKPRW